jgi:hypothetical protein
VIVLGEESLAQEETRSVEELPPILIQRKDERPYFDESKMGPPSVEYVCWIDVMGSRSIMLRSASIAANFVMKLHVAALQAKETVAYNDLELYPMIDGVYACAPTQGPMLAFVKTAFSCLALGFLFEANPLYRFTVRCGLSFGPIFKGRKTTQCSDVLNRHPSYCDRVLLGIPLSQAYDCERLAAPFGVCLDESTRAFAPSGADTLSGMHWKWWRFRNQPGDNDIATCLKRSLERHYDWCSKHVTSILYDSEAIKRHRDLVADYFAED